jgi:hypothetical protein
MAAAFDHRRLDWGNGRRGSVILWSRPTHQSFSTVVKDVAPWSPCLEAFITTHFGWNLPEQILYAYTLKRRT